MSKKPTLGLGKDQSGNGNPAEQTASEAAEALAKKEVEKRAAFLRIGERRVQAALKQIRLLRNLANTSQYSYTEGDVAGMLEALGAALVSLEGAFEGKTSTESAFTF